MNSSSSCRRDCKSTDVEGMSSMGERFEIRLVSRERPWARMGGRGSLRYINAKLWVFRSSTYGSAGFTVVSRSEAGEAFRLRRAIMFVAVILSDAGRRDLGDAQ